MKAPCEIGGGRIIGDVSPVSNCPGTESKCAMSTSGVEVVTRYVVFLGIWCMSPGVVIMERVWSSR